MDNLLSIVKSTFNDVPENKVRTIIPIVDCLMSGLAIFSLKYSSLLQFERGMTEHATSHNLKTLFQIGKIPSDTYMRERLDDVSPQYLRKAFKKVFSVLQRGKHLEKFSYLDGYHLLSIDGTGHYSSSMVHCNSCCTKNHRNGKTTYHHNMLAASIVHPGYKEVIPLAPEPILKQDGKTKNDCEQNAAKRLLADTRREHPHLKLIVIEDALHANSPHIALLKELNMRFIIGAKQYTKDFDYFEEEKVLFHEQVDDAGTKHTFRFINDVSLNSANPNLKVNFLDYTNVNAKGKKQHFTWVTDMELTQSSVYKIMRGGRARWKIENETFNTLKNQGYHFGHNFGHGYKNLATVFANLMFLAFCIDQAQQLGCKLFRAILAETGSKCRLWEKIRALFFQFLIGDWKTLYLAIEKQHFMILELDST